MPFRPINFANIAPIGSPSSRNFAADLMRGFKLGEEPFNEASRIKAAAGNRKARALQNELLKIKSQYLPKQENAQLNLLKQKLIQQQQKSDQPFGGKVPPGAVGQSVWLDKIKKQYGEDSPVYLQAKNSLESRSSRLEATADWRKSLVKAMAYRSLPTNEKNRVIAKAIGLGYTPVEATQLLTSGATLPELADRKKLSLTQVSPSYAPSQTLIRQTQQRKAYIKEISNLENKIEGPTLKYGRKFFGYSPKQVWQSIQNEKPNEQGQFLAARALQPEVAALRLKAAGGQVGIEAIREMQKAALANSRVLESGVSPEARAAMNRYMTQWLNEAVGAYTGSISREAELTQKPRFKENGSGDQVNSSPSNKTASQMNMNELIQLARG